jgi:hypothetical protein
VVQLVLEADTRRLAEDIQPLAVASVEADIRVADSRVRQRHSADTRAGRHSLAALGEGQTGILESLTGLVPVDVRMRRVGYRGSQVHPTPWAGSQPLIPGVAAVDTHRSMGHLEEVPLADSRIPVPEPAVNLARHPSWAGTRAQEPVADTHLQLVPSEEDNRNPEVGSADMSHRQLSEEILVEAQMADTRRQADWVRTPAARSP